MFVPLRKLTACPLWIQVFFRAQKISLSLMLEPWVRCRYIVLGQRLRLLTLRKFLYIYPSIFRWVHFLRHATKSENQRIICTPKQKYVSIVSAFLFFAETLIWELFLFAFISMNFLPYGSRNSASCQKILMLLSIEVSPQIC